jgi:Mce-associated membrane protein
MAEHVDAADQTLSASASVDEESHPIETFGDAQGEDDHETGECADDDSTKTRVQAGASRVRSALAVGVAVVVTLGCVAGWLEYRTYRSQQAQAQRNQLVEAARQGAVNLTTIDYTRVDADIRRILDSSTGSFHDDFEKGHQPFVDVVKQARSKTEGTVTAAGLESQDGDHAQVLVAVSVKTSNAGAPEQEPRGWRMRIAVQNVGDGAKVSAVQFVP